MKKMREVNPHYDIDETQRVGLLEMCRFLKTLYPIKRWTLVEIGTYIGESAAIFADFFGKVITIDPWEPIFMKAISSDQGTTPEKLREELEKNIGKKKNVTFLNLPSVLASYSFPEKSVDIVYIDGWHRVIPATLDIISWLPKVRPGGFIGGHDYRTEHYCEVIPAVRYTLSSPDYLFSDSSWLREVVKIDLGKEGRKR
jgi:predicted O-methyltransferase YrrM